MQQIPSKPRKFGRRIALCFTILLALLLLALVPPLITVNRLQRRIARNISNSLGRPVHLDNQINLNLLPWPGFTLQNLVVSEDPAFGYEPVIRAKTVTARLRISSLWRHQVEFSTISFTDPSVNLVRNPQGKWNLESILLQASRVNAAPTTQRGAGPAQRFPYIEATGARLNLKMGDEKMPLSLTDAEFALWLPNPQQWRVRIEAHPARTDTDAADTGTLKLEATLDRAATLAGVPITLSAAWQKVPLGEASRIVTGSDAGWRGDLDLSTEVSGTLAAAAVTSRARLIGLRRDDFAPLNSLDLDVQCKASVSFLAASAANLACTLPNHQIVLTGDLPDLHHPRTAQLQLALDAVPASWLIDWARLFSQRLPPTLDPQGTITGSFIHEPASDGIWSGSLKSILTLSQALDGNTPTAQDPAPSLDLSMQFGQLQPVTARRIPPPLTTTALLLEPSSLHLGKNSQATLTGNFTASGYTLRMAGTVVPTKLMALEPILPPALDSISKLLGPTPAPTLQKLDLTCTRTWGGPQICQPTTPPKPTHKPHYH